jgi:hypothetical protein
MKLKLDENGHVVVENGMPVYVHDDGKELPFDALNAVTTIAHRNGEAMRHRERAEQAEARLKAFEGIEDPEAAKKALETIKNIDEGKLLSAGKVEEIKAAAKRAAEEQVAEANKRNAEALKIAEQERDALRAEYHGEKIGGAFGRSKFVSEKLAIPPDMVQARFGNAFKVEDGGRVVAYDSAGNKIFSRAKPGDVADFDEALELLVDQYPYKDHILKGTGHRGDGARPNGTAGHGGKTMTRAQFEQLPPAQRPAKIAEGVQIVD